MVPPAGGFESLPTRQLGQTGIGNQKADIQEKQAEEQMASDGRNDRR